MIHLKTILSWIMQITEKVGCFGTIEQLFLASDIIILFPLKNISIFEHIPHLIPVSIDMIIITCHIAANCKIIPWGYF